MSKIDIHNLTKKQRRQMHSWLRAAIQLLYFLFLPSAYTAAFAGVKYIFTQLGAGEKIGLTSSYNQVFFIENSRFFNLSYLSE